MNKDTTIPCPTCQHEFTKSLYDWQFIHCYKCDTYFEKHTGKFITKGGEPQALDSSYWRTDEEVKEQLPRITDVAAKCNCGWWGTVGNCIPDVDGDGSLGCPDCKRVVETVRD